jgi:hypothetical protein
VKMRTGGPDDVPSDLTDLVYSQVWAGHVPLHESFGQAVVDDHTPAGTGIPDYVLKWSRTHP